MCKKMEIFYRFYFVCIFVFSIKCTPIESVISNKLLVNSNFHFCMETDVELEIDCENQPISKYDCSLLKNILLFEHKKNDEFFILNIYQNDLIVYINNGLLYETKCQMVSMIEIDQIQSCEQNDISVSFTKDSLKSNVFLTKSGILRETTKKKKCDDFVEYFDLNDLNVLIRYKEFIRLKNKKNTGNKKNIIKENIINLFNKDSSFLNYYEDYIKSNNIVEMIQDIESIIYIIGPISFIIFYYFKNKNFGEKNQINEQDDKKEDNNATFFQKNFKTPVKFITSFLTPKSKLIKCNCKSGCGARCSCAKNNKTCSELCNCINCTNKDNFEVV